MLKHAITIVFTHFIRGFLISRYSPVFPVFQLAKFFAKSYEHGLFKEFSHNCYAHYV
jgi:hypothetical protein